jgi:hypothetical protein
MTTLKLPKENKMKKLIENIILKQAVEGAFISGVYLGILLAELPEQVAPKLVKVRDPKKIESVWKKEVKKSFKKWQGRER